MVCAKVFENFARAGMIRFFLLTVIIAYGVLIAVGSQLSAPNYQILAAKVSNHFLWFAYLVGGYLWVNRMKQWKLLMVVSLIVLALVIELFLRVRS